MKLTRSDTNLRIIQSLAQRLAVGMTTPHVLRWDILRWNFDVEHVDMVLRHNVQYRASLSGLPILVLEHSKRDQLGREACQRGWNLAFSGGKHWWKRLKLSQNNGSPLAHHFHWVSLSGTSGTMRYHAKPYCLGQMLLGSVRGRKKWDRVREGDYSTCKQNASPTVSNSRPHHLESNQACLLTILLMMICSAFSPLMRFRPFWLSSGAAREGRRDPGHSDRLWSSERRPSRVLQTRRLSSEVLMEWGQELPTVVNAFCLHVEFTLRSLPSSPQRRRMGRGKSIHLSRSEHQQTLLPSSS